eukprot:4696391-Amphidinium_carterae.3
MAAAWRGTIRHTQPDWWQNSAEAFMCAGCASYFEGTCAHSESSVVQCTTSPFRKTSDKFVSRLSGRC